MPPPRAGPVNTVLSHQTEPRVALNKINDQKIRKSSICSLPCTALDYGRCDGGQLPLEMLPEVHVQLVGGHLVVQHEVDGGGDVGEEGLPEGWRVCQVW